MQVCNLIIDALDLTFDELGVLFDMLASRVLLAWLARAALAAGVGLAVVKLREPGCHLSDRAVKQPGRGSHTPLILAPLKKQALLLLRSISFHLRLDSESILR